MRPTIDQYFLAMARLVATRSTCLRRAVGCVLVDARNHVLATGYNGVAHGRPHCNELQEALPFQEAGMWLRAPRLIHPNACQGAGSPSGTDLDKCEAIHAEQNALLQCKDAFAIHACYCTAFPCITCTKLLLNTDCKLIVYAEAYLGGGNQLWDREVLQLTEEAERWQQR